MNWTPSTHHQVPQPAGSECAAWYERAQPSACDILYALAHTKGERDRLLSVLQRLIDGGADEAGNGYAEITVPWEYVKEAQAIVTKLVHT